MNLNEYNALRRVTDAVRAADSAFCEDFYNDEPLTEKTLLMLRMTGRQFNVARIICLQCL